jgi:hypothetical protein
LVVVFKMNKIEKNIKHREYQINQVQHWLIYIIAYMTLLVFVLYSIPTESIMDGLVGVFLIGIIFILFLRLLGYYKLYIKLHKKIEELYINWKKI